MQPKSSLSFWTFVSLAGLAGVLTVVNVSRGFTASEPSANVGLYEQFNRFGQVLERVRNDYVDKPDDVVLIDTAINGMLAALDPHSSYLNARKFQEMQVQTRGEFGGLGLQVLMEDGLLKIVSPIDDTPGARAGLLANDLITHVDGEPITDLTLEKAVEKMRGPPRTPVTLTIVRKGSTAPFDVRLVREVIRVNPVKATVEDDILYVKVTTFSEQAHGNLVRQVETLTKQAKKPIRGYVLDLRNNPGGLLDQAIAISDDFLERGSIVLTKARSAEEVQHAFAKPGDITGGKPIVVLINGGSASASEIVAGALQDHKRATIIGTRSFGKGSVQTIMPLANNLGALRLTTARYYTPSGRSIQAKGIVPDVVLEQELPPELAAIAPRRPFGEANLPKHLRQQGESGEEESGSQSYVPDDPSKDTQLQYALRLLRTTSVGRRPQP